MELTVRREDNISSEHERKDNRYEALVGECEEAGWKTTHSPVEVGCRGFIATGVTKWMRVAGLGPKKRNTITKALQETVEKASHRIWLKRENTSWSESLWFTAKGIQSNWQGDLTSVRGLGAS